MWNYVLGRYEIPDEGKKWVYKTLNDAWRVYKSRMKGKHYKRYNTDEERMENRPDDIPLEDFKMLLKYWGDDEVQALADGNSVRRNALAETHTMGPKPLAQVREKMKKSDPNLASPSDAEVFLETRERKEGRTYKTNCDKLKERFAEIKRMISSGQEEDAALLVSSDKKHAPNWLLGRGGKSTGKSKTSSPAPAQSYAQELTSNIKRDLEAEFEVKMNQKVQENTAWLLKKLGEANPDLKLDIGEFCATMSSDQDDNGTPMTQGGASS